MQDEHVERNQRLKATMRQVGTPSNSNGGGGQKVCSPMQAKNAPKTPIRHIDPGTGKRP